MNKLTSLENERIDFGIYECKKKKKEVPAEKP